MPKSSFQIFGLKEVERALNQLPKSQAKTVYRNIFKKSTKVLIKSAQINVPVGETGNLRRSIGLRVRFGRTVQAYIGPSWPTGFHGHWVEFGTVKTRPRPFLRPAWDANKQAILKAFADLAWGELSKAAKRLAKRAAAGTLGGRTARELL